MINRFHRSNLIDDMEVDIFMLRQKAEDRRQKAEDRRQKEKGRRKKAEG